MTTRTSPWRGTGGQSAAPRDPFLLRRLWAMFAALIIAIGQGGWTVVRAAARHNVAVAHAVRDHLPTLLLIVRGFWWADLVILLMTLAGLLWVLLVWVCWRAQLANVRGSYWSVILPRPEGSRPTAPANRDQPAALWERLIATMEAAGSSPAYLAAEWWGNASGRVSLGLWLPDHLAAQHATLRRLITAERPQARLTARPDPLRQALERVPHDPEETGERWYARAELLLNARDLYPLKADVLAVSSLVAALRPGTGLLACGVSQIICPAPRSWQGRMRMLVQRERWRQRTHHRFDDSMKGQADTISLKVEQPHACVLLRLHVVARTRSAAEAERRTLLQTLTANRQQYPAGVTQRWAVRSRRVERVRAGRLPHQALIRAPMRPLPAIPPLFPLI